MSERRAALVTGAASGIGRAVAGRLVNDGFEVLAVDLDPDPAGPGDPYQADLTTPEGNRDSVTEALQRYGRLDVVVPNAGFQHVAPIEEFPPERWQSLISLLLTSPFLLAHHAWTALGESGRGRFIVIASIHGMVASPFKAGYVSAKHGALGLVKVLALEGAEHGIAATAICPGYVRTPLVEGQLDDQARSHGISRDRVLEEVILEPHAVKRMVQPEEVAEMVSVLTGPMGEAFTGAPVIMDMGWSAR